MMCSKIFWQSQDRVPQWRRLSDAQTKLRGVVPSCGNTEQCRADIGAESEMKPSGMVTNRSNTELCRTDIGAER